MKSKTQVIKELHWQSHWNIKKLQGILGRFRGKKIAVVGDVGIDRYTIGSVERISPEAPVPIVCVTEEKLKLGLAANVADNIQALTGVPYLLGVVGQDREADDFRDLLKKSRIKSSFLIEDGSRRTVLKERVVSDRQQLVRIDYESPHRIDGKIEKQILKLFQKMISSVDAVIVEDYRKGLFTDVTDAMDSMLSDIFQIAQNAGKWVAVDPHLQARAVSYRGATILTPNTKEAEALAGRSISDSASLAKVGFDLLKATGAAHLVITRGKEGMALFSRENPVVRLIPTYAREVYDVSGAGDTVIAVLLLALVAGATLEEAAILGNLAAGIEVGKRGTATVTCQEIDAALRAIF